jgi:hypothetical protein
MSQSSYQDLTRTSEYVENHKKRRDIYLDSNMRIVREDYYSYRNQEIIFTIEYLQDKKIGRVAGFNSKGKTFEIDYSNGVYQDFQGGIILRFKGNYIFDGIQKENNRNIKRQ